MLMLLYAIAFFKALALPLVATWLYSRVFYEAGYEGLSRSIAWVPCAIPLAWLIISVFVLPVSTMLPVSLYVNSSGALNAIIFVFLLMPLGFLAFSSWPIFQEDESGVPET
ncbi:hypothetical protein [Yoonia sp. R2-816]|uniref:hypothetical protein n=1 Tax=Yoonia sp. R2-816 TaxID=3342638 RepID=UPI0037284EFA